VFAAWADAGLKRRWFDLSDANPSEYSSDFRVGGAETLRVTTPEGARITYDAHYRDIVDGERIVATYDMSAGGRRASVSVASVEFAATSGGTRLTYTDQGVYLDGLDDPWSRRSGAGTQLDRLATILDHDV
jgi:uncharacterized protein YndB with AHSA1/START domain